MPVSLEHGPLLLAITMWNGGRVMLLPANAERPSEEELKGLYSDDEDDDGDSE